MLHNHNPLLLVEMSKDLDYYRETSMSYYYRNREAILAKKRKETLAKTGKTRRWRCVKNGRPVFSIVWYDPPIKVIF
jgi:hypothetical protein